jgi:protoheme IX farnesyltransferase
LQKLREAEMEVSVEEKSGVRVRIKAALDLFKLRLSFLVVVSCVLSYEMGAKEWEFDKIGWLILAGFLLAGGSNGANQILERQWDALMHRTRTRPLPTNRISPLGAWFVSLGAAGAGIFILFFYLNTATGILGFSAFLSYAFIYTPLKRRTPWAVFVGAFPGAIPFMLGWVAATNQFGIEAGTLFLIQFFWQFPHFWAIGWFLYEDYKKAGFFLLPSGKQDKKTTLQIILYSIWTIMASIIPVFGFTGNLFLSKFAAVIVVLLGLWMLFYAFKLHKEMNVKTARKLMLVSVSYISLLQIIYVIDKFLR